MAGLASAYFIVFLPGMAIAADGYYLVFAHHRRMSLVASYAVNCCFVLASLAVYHFSNCPMALYAIIGTECVGCNGLTGQRV
jgi:hypothetical protein